MTERVNRWPRVRLEDVGRDGRDSVTAGPFGSNLIQSDYVTSGVPVIRGVNLVGNRFVMSGFVYVTEAKADALFRSIAFPGDVVVTQRGTLGQVALIPDDSSYRRYVISQSQMKLTVDRSKADPEFVYLALLAPESQRRFQDDAIRSGVPHINLSTFRAFEIPLPPLPEQRAIAYVLGSVHSARVSTEQVIAAARELKQSLMHSLFSGGLAHRIHFDEASQQETEFGPLPKHWQIRALDECGLVQTGIAKGRKLRGSDIIEVPYLRVANVQDGFLELREVKSIQIEERELSRYSLKPGDVLLTEGGDFDKLGRGYIWRGQIDPCVHQNHIFAVRVDRSQLLPEYFSFLVQSRYGKAYFLKVAHQTTHLASINSTKVRAFPVPVPPLAEQKRIVRALTAVDHKIATEQQQQDALAALFKSLLSGLMTGRVRVAAHDQEA